MSKIFINYRRDDSSGYAGRLYDRLADHFGKDHVFMDIDQIEPGEDFIEVIHEKLKAVQAAVVLIGKHWLDIKDENGQRRLEHPDDWVRLEIASLLERKIRVIPVLVGDVAMPKSSQLPDALANLARRQAYEISDQRFHDDVDKLIQALERIMGVPATPASVRAVSETAATSSIHSTALPDPPPSNRSALIYVAVAILLAGMLWSYFSINKPELTSGDIYEPMVTNPVAIGSSSVAPPAVATQTTVEQTVTVFSENKVSQVKDKDKLEQSIKNSGPAWYLEKYKVPRTTATDPISTDEKIAEPRKQKQQFSSELETQQTQITNIPIPKKKNIPAELIEKNFAEEVKRVDLSVNSKVIEPQMVHIPPGKFLMGSPETEADRWGAEGPQREVTIVYAFEISKYEITFDEYDAFVKDMPGHKFPGDRSWGRGKRPVIDVSWRDAQAYVEWLSKKTSKQYRLPTEAEWEYVARVGAQTRYWWGDDIGKNNANCDGCGSQWDNRQTAPVGSFKANAFGLHDTAGNVWEWVQDCWHGGYDNAPTDGSAWLEQNGGDCSHRVIRGGSWNYYPQFLRSADRNVSGTDGANGNIGFRIARAL